MRKREKEEYPDAWRAAVDVREEERVECVFVVFVVILGGICVLPVRVCCCRCWWHVLLPCVFVVVILDSIPVRVCCRRIIPMTV